MADPIEIPAITAADRISTAEQYLTSAPAANLALTSATIAIAMLLQDILDRIPPRDST